MANQTAEKWRWDFGILSQPPEAKDGIFIFIFFAPSSLFFFNWFQMEIPSFLEYRKEEEDLSKSFQDLA